jgi:hypothetical protein
MCSGGPRRRRRSRSSSTPEPGDGIPRCLSLAGIYAARVTSVVGFFSWAVMVSIGLFTPVVPGRASIFRLSDVVNHYELAARLTRASSRRSIVGRPAAARHPRERR